uniref:Uncharacterized protein n=1 Tax=Rhizophora mucronata TaxID=61149 RepID=A0A2P2J640_RHIMU
MASTGITNQGQQGGGAGGGGGGGGGFDLNKLFKPSSSPMNMMPPPQPQQQQQQQNPSSIPIPNPTLTLDNSSGGGGGNLTNSPSFPQPSSSSSPYLTPSSSYPPPSGPYHLHQHNPYHPHYLSAYPPPPPPTQLQQNHHHYLPNMQQQQQPQNRAQPISSYPTPSIPSPPPILPNQNPNSGGAVLMEILTNQGQQQQQQPPLSNNSLTSVASVINAPVPSAPHVSLASPTHLQQQPSPGPVRMLSSKIPKGRHLIGSHPVYDIDVRMQGELQPQLEVTPITKYVSDPGLVLGRQIAVNRNYICYGLKPGAIRILNINTALRSLLRGHNQKVTDMAFFAEDVHLLASACVNRRVFVRKISEGPDEEDKPQIFEKIVLALHIRAEGESVHPRVCWHPHKQEILMVATGNYILRLDTIKAGKGEVFSAEEPLSFPIDKLIDGVQLVGKHDGQITELSMCQWMSTRLASASTDGTVKIWEDRKAVPLAVLRPHDGNVVNCVAFLAAAHRPDHIVLLTGGPLNQEVKIWASASEEGWLLPSDAESWQCTQSLTLTSSAESSVEDAFFNQVVALPRAGLFLLANAKKNAIYAVHIEYGPYPAATRMDYIAGFTVTMPILSLTGTSDTLPNGENVVQVYCVQTQAIQQYALDWLQCLPPSIENFELEKTESNSSRAFDAYSNDGSATAESSHGVKPFETGNVNPALPLISSSYESATVVSLPERVASSDATGQPDDVVSSMETKSTAMPSHGHAEYINNMSPPLPLSPRLSRKLSGLRSPNRTEPTMQLSDHIGEQPVVDYLVDHRMDTMQENVADTTSSSGDNSRKGEKKFVQTDIKMVPEPSSMYRHPTHLITPSEILSRATSDNSQLFSGVNAGESKIQDVIVSNDTENVEVEVKVVGEMGNNQSNDFDYSREPQVAVVEKKEKSFYSQASDLSIEMAIQQANQGGVTEALDITSSCEHKDQDMAKDVMGKVGDSETLVVTQPSQSPVMKGKKSRGKNPQISGPSSPSTSPFNSTDSSNEAGCSSGAQFSDSALSQLSSMQNALDQLMSMQREMQKQMHTMISVPVSKEAKRLEGSLGRSIEKLIKANTDALWARFQEENAKHEKLERDRVQQITNLIMNCINKDLPAALEKTLKKEIASVGPAVARAVAPTLEKGISSAITESFQKGVGEKAVNQLEKSVSSKLEALVSRQIQSQFQTSGKQALQDALRSSLEASIVPAFEVSCKAMFDQIDATFQKGLIQHINAAQQQFDSTHSPLAIALRDAINSVSSMTQTLTGELADGQRKLLAIAAAGANPKVGNPSATVSNGPLAGLHELTEAPLDPTKELSRLIAEHKYEEAFTIALHRSDVSIVSWLCSQVDIRGMLAVQPLPLSQGVLLALLQQLSCDISNDTARKLSWMTEVASAINPADPMIVMHVRPIFEQVYQIVNHQRSLPSISSAEASSIRILLLIINPGIRSGK